MIIGGGSRRGAKWFATHLMRTDGGQTVRLAEARGLAGHDIPGWFRQMEAVSFGTRAENYFYHADINPREDEPLTEGQWGEAVDRLEHNLGLDGHSRFVVEHEKNGRTHRHVFWSRIDPDTMTAVSDSKTYRIHERTADELEKAFGHEPTPRGRGPEGRNPHNWEVFRGQKTGIDPYDVGAELTSLWRQADTGPAYAAALESHDYILCEGRRGFCVVDPAGKEHSLARRIEGARKKDIDARMADVDREALPTVEEARQIARDRHAQRKDRDDPEAAQPEPSPLPVNPSPTQHQPSPIGELAEEVLHAVKNGFGKKESLAAELAANAGKPEAFESIAGGLARVAKESGPLAGGIVLAAAAAEGGHLAHELVETRQHPAPVQETTAPKHELSPFERVVAQSKAASRAAVGDGSFIAEGIDWLAGKLGTRQAGHPHLGRALTPFVQAAEDTKRAFSENGGEPPTIGTMSFWQRAVAMLKEVGEQALSLVKDIKDQVTGFVGRIRHDRNTEREHEPDMER
jgi:hypothetical protein